MPFPKPEKFWQTYAPTYLRPRLDKMSKEQKIPRVKIVEKALNSLLTKEGY